MLRDALGDAAHALRTMASRPGLTAVVVLTLAVGIGATTAIFGTVQAALWSRLPFDEPDRLVMGRATFDGDVNPWVSGYDYYDYRDRSESLESLAAFFFGGRSNVSGGPEPERVETGFATWDLFQTLRVKPASGRLFAEEEAAPGAANVVLISYGYWQHRFAGASDAVGSALDLNGSPYTVVGVLPAGFHFVEKADIWRLTYRDGPGAEARRWHNLLLVGRMRPGVTLEKAQSEIDVISRNLEAQYPDTNEGKALLLTPLHDALVENVRTSLLLLMAAVSLVLLLACGNVAGLLLARGQARLTEIAIRSALGASRRRLIQQLLTESTMMALMGGLLGLGLALAFQTLLLRLLPMGQLGITHLDLDMSSLLFALGVSLATGILFGVAPALQGTLVTPSRELGSGTRATSTRGGALLRSGLVVAQVAISVALLIGAGLMVRSLSRQMNVDLGFDPKNLLTAGVRLPDHDYAEPAKRNAFFESLVEEVKALPGVTGVGLVNRLPILDRSGNIYLYRADRPPEERGKADMRRSADFRYVLPGYLETMGIPLLAGRDIARSDGAGSPRVMLVSRSLAELFFPGESPLGKRLVVDMGEMVEHEVVGVVGDARLSRLTSEPFHAMYMSYEQVAGNTMRIAIKTENDPASLLSPFREALRAKDPNIPLDEPETMESILDDAVADYRVFTSALGLFSSVALLLAMVGLYAVLAYAVSQRYHEIGVRVALGARPRQIASLVLTRGMGLVAAGLALGLAGAYGASRLLEKLLFGVAPTDPATFLTVALLCGLVALAACWLPARRATRVDPIATLRSP